MLMMATTTPASLSTATTTPVTSDPTILASRRVVYIGGLGDDVTPQVLRAAMIPFGTIKSLDLPMDYKIGKTRGFAFCEYDDADDAQEAIFNMDGSDLMGRTIKVNLAQQNQLGKLSSSATPSGATPSASGGGAGRGGNGGGINSRSQAIWSSDEWFQQHVVGLGSEEDQRKRKDEQQDVTTLKD
jgi:RNA recognition motif-containing protein